MKKIFSILLAIMMILSMSTAVFAADFTDTADSNHYDAIETLHALGLVGGYDGKVYGPNDELTRAQACAIIINAVSGQPNPYYVQLFNDVPTTHWAFNYIADAYIKGFISGYGNNVFGPDDKVTYDQISTIILNVLGYRNTGAWPAGVRLTAQNACLYDGIVITDGSNYCTRGEVAQMVYNAFDCQTLNNNGFPTGETFAESLGIERIEDTWQKDADGNVTGHMVVTYMFNNKTIITPVITSYAKNGTFKDKVLTIGKKSTTLANYDNIKIIVDNKEMVYGSDKTGALNKCHDVIAIYNDNNKLIAIVGTTPVTVTTYEAGTVFSNAAIAKMENYQAGISTVTQIGDVYKVSNDTYFGYVIDSWNTNTQHCVEFSNGTIIKFKTVDYPDWNFEAGQYVIIFYDYLGRANSYKTF